MSNSSELMHALLVDDDSIYRNFLRQTLEDLGVKNIIEAADGRQAIRMLQESAEAIDLIVCDVYMPEMDGLELLNFLVQHNYRGKLTIVSSGDAMILDVARTFATQSGLQLVGAFPKSAVSPALLEAILRFA